MALVVETAAAAPNASPPISPLAAATASARHVGVCCCRGPDLGGGGGGAGSATFCGSAWSVPRPPPRARRPCCPSRSPPRRRPPPSRRAGCARSADKPLLRAPPPLRALPLRLRRAESSFTAPMPTPTTPRRSTIEAATLERRSARPSASPSARRPCEGAWSAPAAPATRDLWVRRGGNRAVHGLCGLSLVRHANDYNYLLRCRTITPFWFA